LKSLKNCSSLWSMKEFLGWASNGNVWNLLLRKKAEWVGCCVWLLLHVSSCWGSMERVFGRFGGSLSQLSMACDFQSWLGLAFPHENCPPGPGIAMDLLFQACSLWNCHGGGSWTCNPAARISGSWWNAWCCLHMLLLLEVSDSNPMGLSFRHTHIIPLILMLHNF
jgi:hypothetical protein